MCDPDPEFQENLTFFNYEMKLGGKFMSYREQIVFFYQCPKHFRPFFYALMSKKNTF